MSVPQGRHQHGPQNVRLIVDSSLSPFYSSRGPRVWIFSHRSRSCMWKGVSSRLRNHTLRMSGKRTKRTKEGRMGLMMIFSPAKSLDLSPMEQTKLKWTSPSCNPTKTREVATIVKDKTEGQILSLMKVSKGVASTAFQVRAPLVCILAKA